MKAELRRLLQAGAIVDKGTYWYRSPPPTVYRTTRDETLAIAVGYRTAPALGLLIALAVLVHEVPRGLTTTVIMQQAGYSGLRTWLALLVDAGFAPLGVFLSTVFPASALASLTGFTAGVFLYVGASDLLPEAHRRFNLGVLAATLAGGLMIVGLSSLLG